MPTLRDVARLAGVSEATVSNVVNHTRPVTPETRARVERAIAESGFVPRGAPGPARAKKKKVVALAPAPAARPAAPNSALRALLIVRAAQPISRAELARRMEVHRSTVTEIVGPLLAAGVLREEGPEHESPGRSGRPPIGLSFHTRPEFIAGVSLGVRVTQVGAATPDGRLLEEFSFETPPRPAAALSRIRAAVGRLRESRPECELSHVGVSVPGPVDAARERLLYAPHLGWRDVALAEALRGAGGNPGVTVENDATAAALYEVRRRLRDHPRDARSDFILVRVGTGIGVGLVQGGEVFRGVGAAGGMAGEFGHMTIVAGGRPCVCGNRGCWEQYAAESSVVEAYGGGAAHFNEILARAAAGERKSRAALGRAGEYLGIGISNAIMGLGVARVVLGGRIVGGWESVRGPLHEAVARTMVGRLARWSVEPSNPAGAGLGGALELAVEQCLTTLAARPRAAA